MFCCILESGGQVETTVLKGEGEFIARIPIGFLAEDDLVVSLFVTLSPLIGLADLSGFELAFSLVVARSVTGDDVRVIWDGCDSLALVSDRRHRQLTRTALLTAVDLLIDEAQPEVVSMTTHSADLPRPALEKFDQIADVFRARGFKAGRADPYHGRHIWMMQRSE